MGEGVGVDERGSWKSGRNIKKRAHPCFGNSCNFKVNMLWFRGLGLDLKNNQQDLCSWKKETRGRSPHMSQWLQFGRDREYAGAWSTPLQTESWDPCRKASSPHHPWAVGLQFLAPTSPQWLHHQLLTQNLHQAIVTMSPSSSVLPLLWFFSWWKTSRLPQVQQWDSTHYLRSLLASSYL